MTQLRPFAAKALLDAPAPPQVLDVREAWEVERCRIPGSYWIPLGDLMARHAELDRTQPILVVCHHGVRSWRAGRLLESLGFASVINLAGGLEAWACEVEPTMARY